MFDSIVVILFIVLAAITVFYHMKKQLTKGESAGKCKECPLYKKRSTPSG
jgi:hypothetical protein